MTTTYDPVGRCIYCDSTKPPLTKEHIIPFGLGGDRILPKASCEECREITRKIEANCLRNIVGNTRIAMGIQTRHPKERPDRLPIYLDLPDGTRIPIQVSASDFPIMLALPVYEPAKAMRDYPIVKPGPQQSYVWHFQPTAAKLDEFIRTHGGTSIDVGQFEPLVFARFLAKVAHGLAVSSYGIDGFIPNTRELIRGSDTDFNRFVGAGIGDTFKDVGLHHLCANTHNKTGDIAITIQLFANLSAPIYHVLVGRLKRDEPNQNEPPEPRR